MIQFPAYQTNEIRKALDKHTVFAMCGPPGSGNATILKQMGHGHLHNLLTVVHYNEETDNLMPLLGRAHSDFFENRIVVISPADLITKKAVGRLVEEEPLQDYSALHGVRWIRLWL